MLEQITKEQIAFLEKERLNLSHLWLLEHYYKGTGSIELDPVLVRGLIRAEMVILETITEKGKAFYETMEGVIPDEEEKPKKSKKVEEGDCFSCLWELYPRNSTFSYGGIHFQGSRPLRLNKVKCKEKLDKILAEGYKLEDIVKALAYEVWSRKQASFNSPKKENQLQFMQTLEVWLNQKSFEAYIGMDIPVNKDSVPIINSFEI